MASILSDREDGCGFFYGYRDGDGRQINVRHEGASWKAYVGGDEIPGEHASKVAAERAALAWMDENPDDYDPIDDFNYVGSRHHY